MQLLKRFPYQSATSYVIVARALPDVNLAGAVAACGMEKFFSGEQIWRDHRSSSATLKEERDALEAMVSEAVIQAKFKPDSPCDADWGADE